MKTCVLIGWNENLWLYAYLLETQMGSRYLSQTLGWDAPTWLAALTRRLPVMIYSPSTERGSLARARRRRFTIAAASSREPFSWEVPTGWGELLTRATQLAEESDGEEGAGKTRLDETSQKAVKPLGTWSGPLFVWSSHLCWPHWPGGSWKCTLWQVLLLLLAVACL